MYLSSRVVVSPKFNKYPVAGLYGEITCIFATQTEAAKQARKWLKQGHSRSDIICKFATIEEIITQIDKNIEQLTDFDKRFNSVDAITEINQQQGIKANLLKLK